MTYRKQEYADCVVLEPGDGGATDATVIWLHGLGADGHDFVPIVEELGLFATDATEAGLIGADLASIEPDHDQSSADLPPNVAEPRLAERRAPRFVFPHAPVRPVTVNGGARMRAWFDVLGFEAGAGEDEEGLRRSVARIERLVRAERATGPAERRIVLAGFSQGGAIALHAAIRHPESLAGVLALSTWLPLRSQLPEAGAAARGLPVLMCHGLHDPVVRLEGAERSRDALRERGYRVEWKTYPMAHQVCAEEIADISRWLARVLT